MLTKHFFKTLFIFTGILVLGIAGFLLVNYLDQDGLEMANSPSDTACASAEC